MLSLCLALASVSYAQVAPRVNFGAKFELADRVIHGAGQSEEYALADYAAALPPEQFPRLHMAYVQANADAARRERSIGARLRGMARYYPPEFGFQIGVSMTSGGQSYAAEVARGDHDAAIDAIARALDSLGRDVFVRVGYEANGFWNAYEPVSYVAAYRRVVDRMRAISDRFAFVWCVHPIDGLGRLLQYEPGDAYADWWAIDLFQPRFVRSATTGAFLDEALARGKPVMIGESTPTEVGVGRGDESYEAWYAPFFEVIHANPGVKAFCYINRNWTYVSSLPDWGNGLIATDAVVLRRYREEMGRDLYAHLPLEGRHLTAMVGAADRVTVSSTGAAGPDPDHFRFGVAGADTVATYLRFELDTLARDSIRAVKLWLCGRNATDEDRPVGIAQADADAVRAGFTFAARPAAGPALGTAVVNDERRLRLVAIDVTEVVRAAAAAGRTDVAFALTGADGGAPLYYFQSEAVADGYPPHLQIVYDETAGASSVQASARTEVAVAAFPNPSADRVRLVTAATGYELRVEDTSGRLVLRRTGLSGEVELSVGDWPAGVYHATVRTAEGAVGQVAVVRR